MQHVLAGAALVLVDGAVDEAEQELARLERAREWREWQAQRQGEEAGGEAIEGGLDAGIAGLRVGADEERPRDGESHRVQFGHPSESAQADPAVRVPIDDLLDGGQVRRSTYPPPPFARFSLVDFSSRDRECRVTGDPSAQGEK